MCKSFENVVRENMFGLNRPAESFSIAVTSYLGHGVSELMHGARPKNETSRFFHFFPAQWPSAAVR